MARWPTASTCRATLRALESWLKALDAAPEGLIELIQRTQAHRLGRYFELLHQFWLAEAPGHALLASNLPVRDGSATIGELDFVFDDGNGPIHLEVAVKYYVRVAADAVVGAYIGPSLRDRFDIKLHKLVHHQSRRIELPATRSALEVEGLTVRRAQVHLKGVLYEPLLPLAFELPDVAGVEAERLRGYWLPLSAMPLLDTGAEWRVLERLQWLSGPAPDAAPLDFGALMDVLVERVVYRPTQIAQTVEGQLGMRYFVVPDDFLSRAQLALPSELVRST